jgi:glutamine amidotransferase
MSLTVLIDYGSGNLRSAEKALRRAAQSLSGAQEVRVSADPETVRAADRLVLPGVGAFASCMGALKARDGLIEAMTAAAIGRGAPFLGVCVGMQLLASRGLEFGQTPGLDWIPGDVARLAPDAPEAKVPHVGWNDLELSTPSRLFPTAPGPVYFTHSFAFAPKDEGRVTANVRHGGRFAAAVEQDNLAGVQFHPEKSQAEGLAFIARFLAWRP